MKEIKHKPVLLNEVIENLDLKQDDVVFDGTLGSGGYSEEILKKLSEDKGLLIATDLDSNSINISQKRLGKRKNLKIFQDNFKNIEKILKKLGLKKINKAVLDLGWSSDQFQNSGRGLSFQNLEEPLDMNLTDLDEKKKITAYEILNFWEEEEIADLIFKYGEEKGSRLIAKGVVDFRKKQKIEKVKDLVEIIEKAVGKFYKNKKIHSATKTFQALRIYVNQEFKVLEEAIENIVKVLETDGRLAIVTFHSLEDKIIKQKFLDLEKKDLTKRLNKKVIKPKWDEVKKNRRSRSAKLRVLIKK